jgi:hypothetical protein
MDVISWKKTATGKNFAVKLGSAKTLDNGNIAVYLDALPIPDGNGCQITIAPRRDSRGAQAPSRREEQSFARDDMDDEVPF